MREIKFRAWDRNSKTMIKPMTIEKLLEGWGTSGLDIVWMQFIGIRDMYGRDIYEGDILQSENGDTGRIEWDENEAGYRFVTDIGFKYFVNAQPGLKHFEVIGNIYENLELISVK